MHFFLWNVTVALAVHPALGELACRGSGVEASRVIFLSDALHLRISIRPLSPSNRQLSLWLEW